MADDFLIFTPDAVDLSRSPLRRGIDADTYVLGAFNPGLTRLPSGNLLLIVRVAEALREPERDGHVHAVRWTPDGYVLDTHAMTGVDMADPRQFEFRGAAHRILGLTSLSWLLPVELTPDAAEVVAVHYDRAIEPAAPWQDYGVEDARISRIGDRWYMTECSVSAQRHCTALHTSDNGLDWRLEGIILDHQNKDMLFFEGKVDDRFVALTRPLGEVYFTYPAESPYVGGPSINLATSPDALHWRPLEAPGIRARKGSASAMKVGGGTPPILTDAGWLHIWHGVERQGKVGIYRSFWALHDRDDPGVLLRLEDTEPLIEANPALTAGIAHQMYLPTPVVFSTGIVDAGDHYIVASGEADLACRITRLPKSRFS
ncbi:protein of unknown function [Sphingomonas gellani]|uniref:Beta-1,4-mannooligosaccharide/beta-1,4-mannosyl-N-acetylglucosamine phosphorylase n=1 Tax=Sphingomonas gellani TaxID=1166340 RepID=A0A1H8GKG3_9SPHN|nr:glycosidase [Sphingomonas gellani]SEN43977.1 protein of unknown function [Sphingomonas gellani]